MEQLSSQDSTKESVNEDAIFDEVLDSRSAYKKSWGPLPKDISKIQRSSLYMKNIKLKEQLQQAIDQQ